MLPTVPTFSFTYWTCCLMVDVPPYTSPQPGERLQIRPTSYTMASFRLFSSLPPELQARIWEIAIAAIPPRTISIRDRFVHPGNISGLGLLPPRPPALLHACHVSRRQAMRDRYSCAFAYEPIHCFVWMDFETDMLDLQEYFIGIHPDTYKLRRIKVSTLQSTYESSLPS